MLPERLAETSDIRHTISQALGCNSDGPDPGPASGAGAGGSKGKGKARDVEVPTAAAAAGSVDSMDVVGAEDGAGGGGKAPPPPVSSAPSSTGGGGEAAAAAAGSDLDAHSLTAQSMLRCWNAVGERLAAARKVVTEVGMPTKHPAAVAGGRRDDGDRRLKLKRITKGPRGMRTSAGGTGARARKVTSVVYDTVLCNSSPFSRWVRSLFVVVRE